VASETANWLSLVDRTSLPPDASFVLEEGRLQRVEVRHSSQEISLLFGVPRHVPLAERLILAEAIRIGCFGGQPVTVRICLTAEGQADHESFLKQAWGDIVLQAKEARPRLNGMLDAAPWRLEQRRLAIELANQTAIAVAAKAGAAALLEGLVKQETGFDLTVHLHAREKPRAKKAPPVEAAPADDPWAAVPLPPEPAAEPAPEEDPHLSEYMDQWMQRQQPASVRREAKVPESGLLKGKPIPPDAAVRSVRTIVEEENRVVIEGEVFGVETRDTKTGKQMISFAVCDLLRQTEPGDLGDTLPVKTFRDKEKDPEIAGALKQGAWVRVRGNVQADRFSGELTLLADDVMLGRGPTRRDADAGVRRIELHAHTTMSTMDGMIDPEELVRRAVEWGHQAVAVTDHGVTQAFPTMSHVKVPADFKLLYGCELWLVDDGTVIVARAPRDLPLAAAEFIVVDIETTGFSPIGDGIIELGAVRFRGGRAGESFQSFVRPSKQIPAEVQELTKITPAMVADAPPAADALRAFLDFVGDGIVVAHNASFDYSFLRYHCQKHLGVEFANPVLDTLTLARSLLPHLKSHALPAVARELGVPLVDHHRADADARTAAQVLHRLLERAGAMEHVHQINDLTARMNVEQLRPYHVTCLVQKQHGMKNLYKLISRSHLHFYNRMPRVPRTELESLRDGLLIGSACDGGALYDALLRGVPDDELAQLAAWYDYLEIVPRENLRHYLDEGLVSSEEQLLSLGRKIYELGLKLGKPVVAVSDAHFLDPHQQIFRRILKSGIGFRNDEQDAALYLRTTEEMLREFAYLGEEAARQVVIANTHAVAALIDHVKPVPDKLFPPTLEGSEEQTVALSYAKAKQVYGDPLPEKVAARLETELQAICGNGFAVSYYISHLLIKKSEEYGYLVGSRGSVGSSFVAWAMDITEVNPLPPHYICPSCKHIEWHDDGNTGSGFDLPARECPRCSHSPMGKDGQDIPFETFLGFKGEKVPDIDLNFSGEIQGKIQKYSEELLGGEKYVVKAGTVGTIAEKTAYGMVRGWIEENGIAGIREAHVGYLASGVAGVKRTTGQHPGGMVVCPVGMEIEEVTPVQHPADDRSSGVITTHYDYHSFEQALMKLDILGHDDPTMLRMLQDLMRERHPDRFADFDVRQVPVDDEQVLRLFSPGGQSVLGLKENELQFPLGTIELPEMGTRFVRQMLMETGPRTFSDLVRISGLSHGTDVWTNNAQELIKQGFCTLQSCIPCRDDIMVYLMYRGMEPATAFAIMESVRKGRGLTEPMEADMKKVGVPDWYIRSCKTIKYMFPKAHAAAYVLSCLRIAWFKVYYPAEFYATYLTVRAGSVDAELLVRGPEAVRKYMEEVQAKGREATPKEKESLVEYELVDEAFRRNIRFARVDLYQSDARGYLILPDGRLLCPFNSLQGLGDNAAQAIVEARRQGEFQSVEDLRTRARLNKTVVELLTTHGCLKGLSETNQMVFNF
jgi:DNA polymerase III subunit alpha, Gram-positive type